MKNSSESYLVILVFFLLALFLLFEFEHFRLVVLIIIFWD